jgi:hypothetical protein
LQHLPAVAAGFADGALTAGQVSLTAEIAQPERLVAAAERDIDVAEIDDALATMAAAAPHATVKRAVRHYLACLDPDGPEPDPTDGRSLTLSRHGDGTLGLRGQLDAVGGEKLQAALEAIVQAARPAETSAPGRSSRPTRWCSWPTTPSRPGTCRCAGRSSRS